MTDLPQSLAQKPNIPLREQTIEQLREERAYWDAKIQNATGWGAALVAANDFREACDRELERRGLTEQSHDS